MPACMTAAACGAKPTVLQATRQAATKRLQPLNESPAVHARVVSGALLAGHCCRRKHALPWPHDAEPTAWCLVEIGVLFHSHPHCAPHMRCCCPAAGTAYGGGDSAAAPAAGSGASGFWGWAGACKAQFRLMLCLCQGESPQYSLAGSFGSHQPTRVQNIGMLCVHSKATKAHWGDQSIWLVAV